MDKAFLLSLLIVLNACVNWKQRIDINELEDRLDSVCEVDGGTF